MPVVAMLPPMKTAGFGMAYVVLLRVLAILLCVGVIIAGVACGIMFDMIWLIAVAIVGAALLYFIIDMSIKRFENIAKTAMYTQYNSELLKKLVER